MFERDGVSGTVVNGGGVQTDGRESGFVDDVRGVKDAVENGGV